MPSASICRYGLNSWLRRQWWVASCSWKKMEVCSRQSYPEWWNLCRTMGTYRETGDFQCKFTTPIWCCRIWSQTCASILTMIHNYNPSLIQVLHQMQSIWLQNYSSSLILFFYYLYIEIIETLYLYVRRSYVCRTSVLKYSRPCSEQFCTSSLFSIFSLLICIIKLKCSWSKYGMMNQNLVLSSTLVATKKIISASFAVITWRLIFFLNDVVSRIAISLSPVSKT